MKFIETYLNQLKSMCVDKNIEKMVKTFIETYI